MDYQIVPKEVASGRIGGSDYGSSVRILTRAPDAIIFTGGGLYALVGRMNKSIHHNQHHRLSFIEGRTSVAMIEGGREKIDALLGKGMADIALKAWKSKGTALVDGGGTSLAVPSHMARDDRAKRRAEQTCDAATDLTGEIATCIQCGKNLSPSVNRHSMGYDLLPDHPRTIDDCQKLTNTRVIAVFGYDRDDKFGYVQRFETWDGTSTDQQHFCSDTCAAVYGRRAAQELAHLAAGGEPATHVMPETEWKEHGKVKPDRIGPGGLRY